MARRDRVTRIKSHRKKRNQNPKLSPFQREQKRAKLANQVPTTKSMGTERDIPKSQRAVFDYLEARRQRLAERRNQLKEQEEVEMTEEEEVKRAEDSTEVPDVDNGSDTSDATPPSSDAASEDGNSSNLEEEEEEVSVGKRGRSRSSRITAPKTRKSRTEDVPEASTEATPLSNKQRKKQASGGGIQVASLNAEFSSTVGTAVNAFCVRNSREVATLDPNRPRTVEEIIAKKKERKHQRKAEARRLRVSAKINSMEEELKNITAPQKRNRSGKDADLNLAFERELRKLQAEKQRTAKLGGLSQPKAKREKVKPEARAGAEADDRGVATEEREGRPKRKSITFDPSVDELPGSSTPHHAMRYPGDTGIHNQARPPKDFYELVDVVRFGERVESPPVFDAVPNKNAAVSRLANRLAAESHSTKGGHGRQRLLSSVGGFGEQKRLARLGLASAITGKVSAEKRSDMTKEKEMQLLREKVMATYRQKKQRGVLEKKGVNLSHVFPSFS